MQLFFVYDTAFCKADDDPKDGLVYFFPTQACETQRYAVCCQLVGVAKFVSSTFTNPTIIILEEGKFAFHQTEKYLMVLGGSSEMHSNVLKRQLMNVFGIFSFYHGCINNVLEHCNNNRRVFLEKMELIWSHSLRWSQCFGNLLQLSFNALPLAIINNHSNLVARASHLLQICQLNSTVTAGAVFCKNQMLSSQLIPELTSYLTLMSNAHVSSPVCDVQTSYSLPPGVQLKYVYLTKEEIEKVLKYNHKRVGNCIRLKSSLAKHSHCVSSGSEGDIDSGNCSEVFNRRAYRNKNKTNESSQDINSFCSSGKLFYMQSNSSKNLNSSKSEGESGIQLPLTESSVTLHAEGLLQTADSLNSLKDLFQTKGKCTTHEESRYSPLFSKKFKKSEDSSTVYVLPASLLCFAHSSFRASKFTAQSEPNPVCLSSTQDLEFSCCLCISSLKSFMECQGTFKVWKSETDMLELMPLRQRTLSARSHYTCTRKNLVSSKKYYRLQVLRCRSNSDNSNICKNKCSPISEPYPKQTLNENNKALDMPQKSVTSKPCIDFKKKHCRHSNTSKMLKTVLYIQHCSSSSLLLLLSKGYNKKVLDYLWNCGFAILKDIDMEKMTDNDWDKELPFNVMLYNSSRKLLKEDMCSTNSLFLHNDTKECIQQISENFQSNCNLHSISLLSQDKSMFALHSKQNSSFYVQMETSSQKLDTLCNLSKKALRRIDNCFNTGLHHN